MNYVYILASHNNKLIYVGVTNNLLRRIKEHETGFNDSYTKKYNIHKLVYFEQTEDIYIAIAREKQIKKWNREKKEKLIESKNPKWRDLSQDVFH